MPPKMYLLPQSSERYATEPKNVDKFAPRASIKMMQKARSIAAKKFDLKRTTFSNLTDGLIFQENFIDGRTYISSDLKKKNFIVNCRKKNRVVSTYLKDTGLQSFPQNAWVEEVEHESYQGLRDYNEDRIFVKQNFDINGVELSMFAMFDGHGGSSAAEYLKLNLFKTFISHLNNNGIGQALRKSLEELEFKILQCGIKIASGSCATVLVLRGNQFWSANVGDSRILIIKERQSYIQVTDDHKPENPKEQQRIQQMGGKIYRNSVINESTGEKIYGPYRVYPSRLSVSRTIGDFAIKRNQTRKIIDSEADIVTGRVDYGNVILLMSDGAYEQFTNNEISILFANQDKQSLRQRLNNFMVSSRKRRTNDNVSIIGIQMRQNLQHQQSRSTSTTQESLTKIQIHY